MIRAASLEELIDVATSSRRSLAWAGTSVAVLTNAGGLGILCADACEAAGLELTPLADETVAALPRCCRPRRASPTRSTCSAPRRRRPTRRRCRSLLADPHVDAVIVLFVPAVSATADAVATALTQVAAEPPARNRCSPS